MTAEQLRLAATRERKIPWKKWGPYRSRYHAYHPDVFRVGGEEFRVASGWTGVVARLMHFFATVKPDELLERGKLAYAQPAAGSKT